MKKTRKLVAVLVVLFAILAMGLAPAARAGNPNPGVIPPQAHPYGHTYTDWEVQFFQWLMAIPTPQNPALDTSGADCAVGQSGHVWYLLPGPLAGTVVRTCTVPAGRALFVSVGFGECSTVEGNGDTEAELRSCVEGLMATVTGLDMTVDGVHLTNLFAGYQFMTPLFTFNYPADFAFGSVTGPGTSASVAGGNYVMLAPLAAGQHTLDLRAWGSWGAMETTYHLTVRG